MAAQFNLRVFGPPQLLDRGGAPVRFRTKKQLALLTYLHFEGRERPLSRDALADLLWPDAPPGKGRHSLSQALLAIRERLGGGALTRREQDVQLLADLASDLDRLQEGEASFPSLLEPLLGIEDCAGVEFSHWVDASRARIRGWARDALRGALRAARTAGELARVHHLAALLHSIDPLCADAVHALAERALLDGDIVAAVRLLKEQSRRAEQELGTNPNPEIAQLLRRLERGERPGFRAQASGIPAAMTRREVFVGREAEMSRLETCWERARGAGYQTCLVTGAPGIGKSSLVRRFATSLAARAWPAFVVPCQEIGQGIPYAAVSELVTALGRDAAAGGTDPQWLAEASRVCPGLKTIYPGIPDPPHAPTDSIRLRVAEALLRMMEEVSDHGPMLVVFDDVQHMDPASREVLFLVTRRLEDVPFLILATSRPEGAADAASPESGRGTLAWAETIALEPLQRDQTMQLLDDLLGDEEEIDPRIRETIVRLAQGNPYFVEMLLSDWRQHEANSLVAAETDGDRTVSSWSPPETLRLAFERHYRGLSAESQHLLQLLAVAERAMATPEIALLLGLDVVAVERAVMDMLDRGIGRVESGRLAFKNELHRAYVYYAMGEERRRYFHTRVAEWLAREAAPDDFQRVLEASHHYVTARMPSEACHTALAGAELAVRRGAPGEAERTLVLLLRSYPQDTESRVHLVLANALVAEGKFRDALDAVGRWRPLNPAPSDRALAAQMKAEALHRGRLGDDDTILDSAVTAVSVAEAAKAELTLIRALQVRAEVAAESGRLNDAEEAGARAQTVAEHSPNPECKLLATVTRGYCLLATGRYERAAAAFTEAVPVLSQVGLFVELHRVLNGAGMCYTALARLHEAVRDFGRAILVARKLGDRVMSCNLWSNLGAAYQDGGDFEVAGLCYQHALDLLPLTSRVAAPLYANVSGLAIELGDFVESERYSTLALMAGRETRSFRFIVAAQVAQADLHLAKGEPERAWPLVEDAIALAAGRWRLLTDVGQFARLQMHFLWKTKGYDAVRTAEAEQQREQDRMKVADRLELLAVRQWIAWVEGDAQVGDDAELELVKHGVFGVMARLIAVGVRLPTISVQRCGESSARLVARVYPPDQRPAPLVFDDLLRPSDAPLHSA
jgi:DNA-binding SARP family transcriptional activator